MPIVNAEEYQEDAMLYLQRLHTHRIKQSSQGFPSAKAAIFIWLI